ncbi:protein phosphatase 4 core regulatory subunit R2 [Ophiocordyceps camponoti-floridani]|uniref:Protein phosphatase 4 core regulatory subunit R2 n=1 Tax=Ophiocordyceps camponoti-floridani TaxID=2030778 RepID=A0A8H4VFJ8_9HYPO|nr:protein phosphatase 4 core regulatory subunit R2 [Ophiocordyceps camponoti-floridani]
MVSLAAAREETSERMAEDGDSEVLAAIAAGEKPESGSWPGLLAEMLARLDEISHEAFPIPKFGRSRSFQGVSDPDEQGDETRLPPQIAAQLARVKTQLSKFPTEPPHTVQRLAELLLSPRAHYKALASYLHAVDRVVHVTSDTAVYPLPPPVPDMAALRAVVNGEEGFAAGVAWSKATTSSSVSVATLGSDEALGGALLTPVPWLTRSPEASTGGSPVGNSAARIHSEGSETIEGPNGMGRVETEEEEKKKKKTKKQKTPTRWKRGHTFEGRNTSASMTRAYRP